MNEQIELPHFRCWLLTYAERIADKEVQLTELDAAIGDADHGINMHRGTARVKSRLVDLDNNAAKQETSADVGALLRTVAMTLINSIGGAAGPLYGAFFLHAAKEVNGHGSVTLPQLALMFRSGLDGIKQRGKAQLNDKTMIDALQPAVDALEAAVKEQRSIADALSAACEAARMGMINTIGLQANKGRASYLGPRSVGHQDPGATSAYYLIETAMETLGREINDQ